MHRLFNPLAGKAFSVFCPAGSIATGSHRVTQKLFRFSFSDKKFNCISTHGEVKFDEHNDVIRIQNKAWPESVCLSSLWLRDHCRCPECFNHSTIQRKLTPNSKWLNVQPADITVNAGSLIIQWDDGHRTTYDLDWLWKNSFEIRKHSFWVQRELWNPNRLQSLDIPNINFEKLLNEESAVAQLLHGIITFGFGFVSSTPSSKESTCLVIERISEIHKNLWGGDVNIVMPDKTYSDMAYGTSSLTPHTDCNYLYEAPGLQVFHVLEQAPQGGETLLVDGFYAAEQLKARDPSAYEILSSAMVQFEYRDKNGSQFYKNTDTIIKHNPITKELDQIRFCTNDLSPLSTLPPELVSAFYRSYVAFFEELVRNQASFRLLPGTVLFIDNWRVLHSRSEFSGRRILATSYVGRSDYFSRARTLGVISGLQ